jgi:hypothetical protein
MQIEFHHRSDTCYYYVAAAAAANLFLHRAALQNISLAKKK